MGVSSAVGRFMALACTVALVSSPMAVAAQSLTVGHNPVKCVLAEKVWQLEATAVAGGTVSGKAYFKPAGTADFYYVNMETDALTGSLVSRMPAPAKAMIGKELVYYIFAAVPPDSGQTQEVTVKVVGKESDCDGPVAPVSALPAMGVLGPGGVVTAVPGFIAGAAGAVGGAAGISTAVLVGGALGAGAIAVGIAASGGNEPSPAPSPSPSPAPGASPQPVPSPSPTPVPSPSPEPPPASPSR